MDLNRRNLNEASMCVCVDGPLDVEKLSWALFVAYSAAHDTLNDLDKHRRCVRSKFENPVLINSVLKQPS